MASWYWLPVLLIPASHAQLQDLTRLANAVFSALNAVNVYRQECIKARPPSHPFKI